MDQVKNDPNGEALARARVLVVDDDEMVRVTAKAILERAGHQVDVAVNGNKALAHMAAHGADVIILDVIMPEKEGLETLLNLKRDFPAAKIIAISGGGRMALDDFLVIAKRLGADATLKKPIRPQALLAEVANVLGLGTRARTTRTADG